MVPVIESCDTYQPPPSVMAPTGIKKGFRVTSEFVPKVDLNLGGLTSQQSYLWIIREDFMHVAVGNVAFQN
jgi:hypothetical protein